MIVDFQHHFIPREMAKEPPASKAGVHFDKDGVPSMTPNAVLYDLDEHIDMMDTAGIDAAFLTVPPAMCASLEVSRLANDKTQAAVKAYPGRFIGGAHVNPLARRRRAPRVEPLLGRARLSRRRHHLRDRRRLHRRSGAGAVLERGHAGSACSCSSTRA